MAGVVTAYLPGPVFYLSDGTGSVAVVPSQAGALRPGDRVETVAFPGLVENRPALLDAFFRKTGEGPAPQPAARTASWLMEKGDDALVQVEGRPLAGAGPNGAGPPPGSGDVRGDAEGDRRDPPQ